MTEKKFFTAIILSAGSSQRMGYNKMLLKMGNKTVFERTVEAFEECDMIDEIIIATPKESVNQYGEIVREAGYTKVKWIVPGGASRQESVANALAKVSNECEYIAVHDGARPLIKVESIEKVCQAAIEFGGAVASVMSVDTLKSINEAGMIVDTIDREKTVQVRTPQIFKKEILLLAHEKAKEEGFEGTDECMLVERCNFPIKTVITGRDNIKLTYPEDVLYMTEVLRERGTL
ncbi:MAG: 2-C-methyl-D-erythritol 4-phosphate cytidylyltransferase [Clostridia bacterium]|nr:2-C-methyl-D-erythritol 4-phosphate cytidylyltransferase [Clostridia bacterium]